MVLDAELKVFLVYAAVIMLVYFIGKAFTVPVKIAAKLAVNSILGGLILLLINNIGFGVLIPLNFVTSAAVGAAGIPAVLAALIYYQNIL